MKRLAIVGSTGSIGQNTLRVVEHLSDRFRIFALAANSAVDRLAEQTAAFHPAVVGIRDGGRVDEFVIQCQKRRISIPEVVTGEEGLRQIASAGPFRETRVEQFEKISPEEALKHPVWQRGKRITVDSATLMNKGLEVIEAPWLFVIPSEKIDIMVHPQSIVHSMVEFVDGSVVAQLGTADMRQPIQYALTYPERLQSPVESLNWAEVSRLDFMQPARKKFPCISLAYRAIEAGGTAPAVLNAADEIAVEAFLNRKISFSDIPKLIAGTLEAHKPNKADRLETIIEADTWARKYALQWLS